MYNQNRNYSSQTYDNEQASAPPSYDEAVNQSKQPASAYVQPSALNINNVITNPIIEHHGIVSEQPQNAAAAGSAVTARNNEQIRRINCPHCGKSILTKTELIEGNNSHSVTLLEPRFSTETTVVIKTSARLARQYPTIICPKCQKSIDLNEAENSGCGTFMIFFVIFAIICLIAYNDKRRQL